MRPIIQERSPDTQILIDVLRGVNDEIDYDSLASRCRLSIIRMKTLIASARRSLRSEKILFGTIRGFGLRRLSDIDKARKTEGVKKRISRSARRELKDLATIHYEALPNQEQIIVSINRVTLSAILQQALVKPKAPPEPAATAIVNVPKLIEIGKKRR